MGGRGDGRNRDHDLVGDEELLVGQPPAGREAVTLGTPPLLMLPAEGSALGAQPTARAGAPVETVDRLRRWRLETARAAGIPAYVVFHDSTLTAIAAARPASLDELLRVPGVGDAKLRKYGEEVLEVLRTL